MVVKRRPRASYSASLQRLSSQRNCTGSAALYSLRPRTWLYRTGTGRSQPDSTGHKEHWRGCGFWRQGRSRLRCARQVALRLATAPEVATTLCCNPPNRSGRRIPAIATCRSKDRMGGRQPYPEPCEVAAEYLPPVEGWCQSGGVVSGIQE